MELATVILAAGLGTRMKSSRAKVLHPVAQRPMIEYPFAVARALGSRRIVCVLGHQLDAVRAALIARFGTEGLEIVEQREQRGTGHAVLQAAPALADQKGLLLILCGDVPLLTKEVLERLVASASPSTFAMLTATPRDPTGYGRIVRDEDGKVLGIVEHKDASPKERAIDEINAGIYCGPASFILKAIKDLKPNNAQGELYLTDIVARASRELSVVTVSAPMAEVMGCNDRVDLARADRMMRVRLAEALMRDGVTVRDPESLYLEPGILVGRDSELGPGVHLRGKTRIGAECRIDAGVVLSDTVVGDRVHIKPYCVLTESVVGNNAQIGPWAHLRPGSVLEDDVHLGNFVETKKTRMGKGAKANHLSYLGDADIGARSNIGCGTITCNYDGYKKYQTVIGDGVFIGSDTQLVAPVTVGDGAVTGAGTTVYQDVPAGALLLTRAKSVIIAGYAQKKRDRMLGKPAPKKKAVPKKKAAPKKPKKKSAKKR